MVQMEIAKKYTQWRYKIFVSTWLAYAGFYLTRKSFSVAKIGMAADPDILLTKTQMSNIEAGYLVAYAIGQFLWGMTGDRYGTRKVILTGMLLSIITAIAMGLSTLIISFGVLFFIQGLCQSTGWAPLVKNFGNWFSRKERGTKMGWWCTNYAIGGFIASPFAGFCADYFTDWRYGFFVPAIALFLVWILFIILQRNKPEDVGLPPIEEFHGLEKDVINENEDHEEGSWKTVISVYKNKMVLLLGAFYFFLKPTRYAIFFWAPLYVSDKFGTGMTESAVISVFFELGGPLGIIAAGYFSDRMFASKRFPISIIFLFLLAITLFSFNYFAAFNNIYIIAALLFAIGFFLYGPDSLLTGAAAVDFGTKKGAGTATGFINGSGSVGAVFGGALPGYIAAKWGWDPLFIILGCCVLVAGLILIPKWHTLPKTKSP